MRRIDYAGSVHDEEEISACLEVLRGGATALRIGANALAFEEQVAELFGKRRGFPIQIRRESGVRRGEFQQWMEGRGVDTRMVWSGNILRQPGFRKIAHRAPADGLHQRRPRDGDGPLPALQPRDERRRRRLRVRDDRRVPGAPVSGEKLWRRIL